MAANDYQATFQTTSGETGRIKPQVRDMLFRVQPDRNLALAVFNAAGLRGGVRGVGHQKFTSKWEWPIHNQVVNGSTAAAAAATTLTLLDTGQLTENSDLYVPSTEEYVRVTSVDSATQVTVDAITNAIPANEVLLVVAHTVGENWTRPTPVTRATDTADHYTSTIQHSWAITWHMDGTEVYGMSEPQRLRDQGLRYFEEMQNRALIFSEPRDGGPDGNNDGRYKGTGLWDLGRKYNSMTVPGTITPEDINEAASAIRTLAGEDVRVLAATSRKIINQISFAPQRGGVDSFTRQDIGNNQLGSRENRRVTIPFGDDIEFVHDRSFDMKGNDDRILFWAPELTEPVEFKNLSIVAPNASRPEGAADAGGGAQQTVMTRCIGWDPVYPEAACVAMSNVKRVRRIA